MNIYFVMFRPNYDYKGFVTTNKKLANKIKFENKGSIIKETKLLEINFDTTDITKINRHGAENIELKNFNKNIYLCFEKIYMYNYDFKRLGCINKVDLKDLSIKGYLTNDFEEDIFGSVYYIKK